jgi:hypothetical protein
MIVPRGRDLRTAERSLNTNERDFTSGVWRLGESVEKILTVIQNKYIGLSSCYPLTDGSGPEEFWLRDIRGEKEVEPSPISTGNSGSGCVMVLVGVLTCAPPFAHQMAVKKQ